MSMLQLIVNESTRKLSNRISNQVFVVNDANVDTIRFSIPAGFSDIDIDENASFRVMYIPPGIDKTVYAKTLTFVQNDGVYISYDWQVGPNVLVESGILTVSFCILKTGSEVQEWHTIPYTIPVSNTIHTDDGDEADETITPTVAQRVAVLESMIQRVASGAPVVVGSVSEMTDTTQIYVLSTDGMWYYHNGTAWVAGGEYGAVATDRTLTQSGIPADAEAVGDKIAEVNGRLTQETSNLQNAFDGIAETSEVQTELTFESVAGIYIGSDRYGTASATTFFVRYIPVAKGKKYRITASPIKTLFAQYGLVAFSENIPAGQVPLNVLVEGSTEEISIDYTYNAESNGYLGVSTKSGVNTVLHFYEVDTLYHVITDKTLMESNQPADSKSVGDRFDLLGYGAATKDDVIPSLYTVVNRYIGGNGRISSAGRDVYAVAWYPVVKGKIYLISGTASTGGSGQGLVCFDNVYDSTVGHRVKTVLQTATTVETEYNIPYTPTEDGYIVMPKIDMNKLTVKLVSDTDFQRIYDIEKAISNIEDELGNTKIPVKIQLFGDSITDNLWGDKTTWANYIQQNLSSYDVTVVNDAVGGSGIGHGASKGTTESHQTEDYNYVWDLVTDGTTLQTDANYIVILVGTNNWASGTDLGDMSSTGYSTIYGALKGILEYISQHTSATVFVCTIPQRYNSVDANRDTNSYGEPLNPDNVSLADYCEAFRKVSAFYGTPCIHLNEDLGWNRLNISNFSGDGLHPNSKGDKMLSAFICSEIKKHIGNVSYT